MNQGALLLLAVFIGNLLPEHLVGVLKGTVTAWEFVCDAVQDFIVWGVVGSASRVYLLLGVSAWAMLEAGERAMCRLLLPMDHAPGKGQFLCDRVISMPIMPVSQWSLMFAGVVAVYAADRVKL